MRRYMKQPTRVKESDGPERPPCATCAAPATCVMSLDVRDLVLDRDSGVRSSAYWTTSYKTLVSSVEMRLCAACVASHVKVSLSVEAKVTSRKKEG